MTLKNLICRKCGKGGKVKLYIIADDLENSKPYHKKCIDEIYMQVMLEMNIKNIKNDNNK